MRFYIFIILACIGVVLGAKQVFGSLLMGTGHDVLAGTAMFLFSLVSIIAVAWNVKRKGEKKL